MTIGVERRSSYIGVCILVLAGLSAPAGVTAQQAIVPLQLSFSDPGARSMGFGIDTMAGLRTATSEYDATGLSYLSLAYPIGNWSMALYRHEYANLEFASETQGLFGGGSDCCQTRLIDQRATSRLDVVSYGLSAAYQVSDALDVGLGVVYYDASLEANVAEYLWDDDTLASFFSPNSYLTERWNLSDRLFSDDTDWAFAGGFLWRLSERWRIGGVYRQGPEIEKGQAGAAD